jgi:hypothetical protein
LQVSNETIPGTAYLHTGATDGVDASSKFNGGVVQNSSGNSLLDSAASAASSAASTLGGLACTQTFGAISGSKTITGVTGRNVICVNGNISLTGAKQHVLFSAPVGGSFVVRVTGKISETGGGDQIGAVSGFNSLNLLYDVEGGNVSISNAAEIDGIVLDLNGKIAFSAGVDLNGELIGNHDITITSGSKLMNAVPEPGSLALLATVLLGTVLFLRRRLMMGCGAESVF